MKQPRLSPSKSIADTASAFRGSLRQLLVAIVFVLFATIGSVAAQNAPVPDPNPKAVNSIADLPPEIRLGVRVEITRRRLPVAPIVVVVPDAARYLDAIEHWSLQVRFPVLIHDGSAASLERIAKFVRAFEPELVVRWDGEPSPNDSEPASVVPSPTTVSLVDAVAHTWGAEDRTHLIDKWKSIGFAPPGVLVASLRDRAWPAAIALAAGRGEPIIWLDNAPKGPLGNVLAAPELDRFVADIEADLDSLNAPWRQAGDMIEAVTICLNMPTRIPGPSDKPNEPFALTDHIGRHADNSRWAWSGMIFGDESEAAWKAMCALFLQPKSAWLFDGYQDKSPFNQYGVNDAATLLTQRGMQVIADQRPQGGITNWRARCRLGVDAGLIHINSSGSRARFNLTPGKPYASETPILWKPAIVHFIHSFSAQRPEDPRSIAHLWMKRGAYAYAGSVQEPFLTSFVTPAELVQRLYAPSPWGVAVRKDIGRVWRINIFGDPLITLGPPAPSAPAPDLEGAQSVADIMRQSLRDENYETGVEALVMLGKDGDVASLIDALLDEHPEQLTPGVAALAWRSLLQTGQIATLYNLIDHMDQQTRYDPELTDLLWLALRPKLAMGNTDAITLLQSRLRKISFGDDAADIADALGRSQGAATARLWLTAKRDQAPDERTRKRIDKALRR